MKGLIKTILLMTIAGSAWGQDHPHYTMFMYNKLLYNPAYAGSRDITSANAIYRSQWVGLDGAPRTMSAMIDGPIGSYMKAFRPVALGLSVSNEKIGVTDHTDIMTYYAYRIPTGSTVLSFGLQAGVSMYSARYSELNPYQPADQVLNEDIKNAILPNVGAGVFWSGNRHYLGFSVPGLLQNYYDKNQRGFAGGEDARQIRSYYMSGGYTIPVSDNFTFLPQAMARYAGNGIYQLPFNADFNLSCIMFDRLMLGVTYRTDNSINGIIHVQATKMLHIGYAYDYTTSGLNAYSRGTHEVMVGLDFVRDLNRYVNPRFIRNF